MVTNTKIRNALAEALWDYVSANQLADACDELKMPPAPDDVHPMSSKRTYVLARTKGYELDQLVAVAREIVLDYPHKDLVAVLAELDGAAGGVAGVMKNIVFAAVGPKPQLLFSDALNNDVQIAEGSDRCLITTGRWERRGYRGAPWCAGGEGEQIRRSAALTSGLWRSRSSTD